uniref:Uncharacterized protein n=1 Tax=Vespula pensylvanica TaxID=30213 RepID=A0A834UH99_VESPE|nr:hypothetical protein H0235_001701 [Vespula pensylvanica]
MGRKRYLFLSKAVQHSNNDDDDDYDDDDDDDDDYNDDDDDDDDDVKIKCKNTSSLHRSLHRMPGSITASFSSSNKETKFASNLSAILLTTICDGVLKMGAPI